MAQQHLDRLSSTDVSFLTNESSSSHMHVGAIMIFEGPAPSYEDLLDHIQSRLRLVPRFRQKLAYPPVQTGRPFWVDDPNLNLEYHVRHSALPAPGSEDQLRRMAARVFSQQLDRSKPLWELWLVQGLTRNRFALLTKTHHAVVDGVVGRRHRHRPVRPEPGAGAAPLRRRLGSAARAVVGHPAREGRRGRRAGAGAGRPPPGARRAAPGERGQAGQGRGRGRERGGLELRQPGAQGAAERRDRLPPPVRVGQERPRPLQAGEERPRRHRQRRRARGCRRRPSRVAARPRDPHRGSRAPGPGPGEHSRLRRARPARQQARRDARPAAGLHRRPRSPARGGEPGDERAEAVQAGPRGRGDLALQRLRASHPARAGGPDQLLHPPLQPDGHERPRAAGARSTSSGASSRTSSRSGSCRQTRRSSWRS